MSSTSPSGRLTGVTDATSAVTEPGYDIIGDVHGYADRLRSLLELMGYCESDGAWRHDTRQAVFVGDLIDRGSSQLETLRLVRAMVEAGSAQIVLGNHEFNAVAYATLDPTRFDYCRPHNKKNDRQHKAFLDEVEFGSPLHRSIIDWFMQIPLWLDLDGVRVVHACWSNRHMVHLRNWLTPDNTLTEQAVIKGSTKGTATYDAIETILKGPEIWMNGACCDDKDGNPRHHARRRWWDGTADTLRSAALIPAGTVLFGPGGEQIDELDDTPLSGSDVEPYNDSKPVLFGHYWWRKESAEEMNPLATCVDFSVAENGVLRAYRWSGEAELTTDNFVDC
jgi:hypothetical protein